jgi:hypothetical protein
MEQPVNPMHSLSKKILDAVEGEPFDDLVPAVTLVLADIGVSSGVGADVFIAFVSKSIRGVFAMREEHESSLH